MDKRKNQYRLNNLGWKINVLIIIREIMIIFFPHLFLIWKKKKIILFLFFFKVCLLKIL
jgi:hypothetical protein